MGANQSTATSDIAAPATTGKDTIKRALATTSGSECPSAQGSSDNGCSSSGGCPVKHDEINPINAVSFIRRNPVRISPT